MFVTSMLVAIPWTSAQAQSAQIPDPLQASNQEQKTIDKKVDAGSSGIPQPGLFQSRLFQPGLLLQGWFIAERTTEMRSTFRLRRAEMHLKGEMIPARVGYALMIDPAKVFEPQDTVIMVSNQTPPVAPNGKPETITVKQPMSAISMLQDVYITFQTPFSDISFGQFKIPVSLEGVTSSSKLLFAERASVSRAFGDKRDIGLRLAKTFQHLGYSAGIFNGAGLNNLDTNNAKDMALRLEVYPIKGLTLAGVLYGTLGQWNQVNTKDRYEVDLRYERAPFLFQAEYIRSRDVANDQRIIEGQGFYSFLSGTYGNLEPCIRVGYLDPDIHPDIDPNVVGSRDRFWQYDLGLNYYWLKHEAKFQLNYSRFQYQDHPSNNQVILATQIAY